jgi:hypothetical protein
MAGTGLAGALGGAQRVDLIRSTDPLSPLLISYPVFGVTPPLRSPGRLRPFTSQHVVYRIDPLSGSESLSEEKSGV